MCEPRKYLPSMPSVILVAFGIVFLIFSTGSCIKSKEDIIAQQGSEIGANIYMTLDLESIEAIASGIARQKFLIRQAEKQERARQETELMKQRLVYADYLLSMGKSLEPLISEFQIFGRSLEYMQYGNMSDLVTGARHLKKEITNAKKSLMNLTTPIDLPPEINELLEGQKQDLIKDISGCSELCDLIILFVQKGNFSARQQAIFAQKTDEIVSSVEYYFTSAKEKIDQANELMGIPPPP